MEEFVEFDNERTGKTRRFPRSIMNSLAQLCLRVIKPEERATAEEQVWKLCAAFLDEGDVAEPIRAAAAALFPSEDGIQFNVYSPEVIQLKIKGWATAIFERYGNPVYLVGSALKGTGRDVDIRVILPDAEFHARFADYAALALEVGKQSRHAALFCRMNIDFKIQSASEAREFADLPKLRVDGCEYPEGKEPPKAGIGIAQP